MSIQHDLLKGGLIVSCQALEDEPLHSAFIMGRMARAAKEGLKNWTQIWIRS